jgi:hypothetical protein
MFIPKGQEVLSLIKTWKEEKLQLTWKGSHQVLLTTEIVRCTVKKG